MQRQCISGDVVLLRQSSPALQNISVFQKLLSSFQNANIWLDHLLALALSLSHTHSIISLFLVLLRLTISSIPISRLSVKVPRAPVGVQCAQSRVQGLVVGRPPDGAVCGRHSRGRDQTGARVRARACALVQSWMCVCVCGICVLSECG